MKKYLFILLLFLSFSLTAQVKIIRVADATTAIGENISQGTQVFNRATNELWIAKNAVISTATLTTASASFDPSDTILNIATTGEINTGTVDNKAMSPLGFAGSDYASDIENNKNALPTYRIGSALNGGGFFDDFDRSDRLLNNDISSSGETWTVSGSGASTANIINNELVSDTGLGNFYASANVGSNLEKVTASYSFREGEAGTGPVLIATSSKGGLTNMWHLQIFKTGWQLDKWVGGVSSLGLISGRFNSEENIIYGIGLEIDYDNNIVKIHTANGEVVEYADEDVASFTPVAVTLQCYNGRGKWHAISTQNTKSESLNSLGFAASTRMINPLFGYNISRLNGYKRETVNGSGWYRILKKDANSTFEITGTLYLGAKSSVGGTSSEVKIRGTLSTSLMQLQQIITSLTGTSPVTKIRYSYATGNELYVDIYVNDNINDVDLMWDFRGIATQNNTTEFNPTMGDLYNQELVLSNTISPDINDNDEFVISNSNLNANHYAKRVLDNGGVFESLDQLFYDLNNVATESIQFTPNAVQADTIYGIQTSDYENGTDGDFIYTRSGTATRTNVNGLIESVASNVARVDYSVNPSGELLLEPSVENIIKNNQTYQSFAYNSSPSPTPLNDQGVAPNGLNNAWKFAESSTGAAQRNITIPSNNNSWTWSVYVKPLTSTAVVNTSLLGINGVVTFSGNIYTATDDTVNAAFNRVDLPNGWIRISKTFTNNNSGTLFINRLDAGTNRDEVLFWGAQLEQLPYASSVNLTAASTVTRAAEEVDSAGSTTTINTEEGVIYIEAAALFDDLTLRTISVSDGTSANYASIGYDDVSNQIQAVYFTGGVAQADLTYTVTDITDLHKIGFKWAANDFDLWVDGTTVATDLSGSVAAASTFNELQLSDGANGNAFYGRLRELKVFPVALTDAELTALTSKDDYTPKHLARTDVDPYFTKDVTVQGDVTANSVNGIYRKKISLTSSQILSLNSTPVEAIAAPGVGKVIIIHQMTSKLTYGTATYSGASSALQLVDSTLNAMSENGILFSGSTIIRGGSSFSDKNMSENSAIDLYIPLGNPNTGDSSVDVYITYEIIDL